MSLRLLGTLGMMGAPLLLLENALFGFGASETTGPLAILGSLFMLGWLCSCIGLWQLAATGDGAVGRGILGLQMILVVLAAINNGLLVAGPAVDHESLLFVATDLAWPLSHVYMLVVGIAAAVARRLEGWRRWAPLGVGLVFPITLVVQMLLGALGVSVVAEYFAIIPALLLLLLGYAIRSASDAAAAGAPLAVPGPTR